MRDQFLKAGLFCAAAAFATACSDGSQDNDNSAKNAEPDSRSVTLSDVNAEKGSADTCVLLYDGYSAGGMTSIDVGSEKACLKAAAMQANSNYKDVHATMMLDGQVLGTGFRCLDDGCKRTQVPSHLKGGPQ